MTGGATPPQGAVGVSEYPAALSLSSGPSTPAASTASSAPSAGSWGCFALFSLIKALLVRLRRSRHYTSPLFSMVADRRTAEKGKKHGPPRVRKNPFSHAATAGSLHSLGHFLDPVSVTGKSFCRGLQGSQEIS